MSTKDGRRVSHSPAEAPLDEDHVHCTVTLPEFFGPMRRGWVTKLVLSIAKQLHTKYAYSTTQYTKFITIILSNYSIFTRAQGTTQS